VHLQATQNRNKTIDTVGNTVEEMEANVEKIVELLKEISS
jgi:predicted RNase H-like HicB family nuclease